MNWLKGSGWLQALVEANITTPWIADSFLQAAHVAQTLRTYQVTITALHVLKHCAYDHYCLTCIQSEQELSIRV